MTQAMWPHEGELAPTRRTLLERLRNLHDDDSWREFCQTYAWLVGRAATRAGLDDQETEDVVQATLISVARGIGQFRYEPEKCSFKGWLMNLTRHHIIDSFRKRRTQARLFNPWPSDADHHAAVEEVADGAAEQAFENLWTEEWHQQLLEATDSRVRRRLNPVHYQVYYLHVVKGRPVLEVSQALGVGVLSAHVICHRVVRKMRREVQRLETGFR